MLSSSASPSSTLFRLLWWCIGVPVILGLMAELQLGRWIVLLTPRIAEMMWLTLHHSLWTLWHLAGL